MTLAFLVIDDEIPSTYKEAIKSLKFEDWNVYVDEEMDHFIRMKLGKEEKAIGCKWVYAKKLKSLGEGNVRFVDPKIISKI